MIAARDRFCASLSDPGAIEAQLAAVSLVLLGVCAAARTQNAVDLLLKRVDG